MATKKQQAKLGKMQASVQKVWDRINDLAHEFVAINDDENRIGEWRGKLDQIICTAAEIEENEHSYYDYEAMVEARKGGNPARGEDKMADKDVRIDEAGTRLLQTLVKNNDDAGVMKFLGLDWENLTCWFCGRRGHIMKQCTVPKDKRLPREQGLAIARGKAFVSDDGEFIPMVLPNTL
ncbi:MAG: C2HC-type zinc finger protein [Terriglobia bacterium]